MNSISALLSQFRQLKLKLALEGILIGLMSGLFIVFYRLVLEKAEELRSITVSYLHSAWQVLIGFLLLILLALFVGRLMIKDPMICGSGIPQVEGILANKLKMNPLSVLVRKFIGGTLYLGAGLSVGREGPSIQLGAAMAQYVSQLTKRSKLEEKYLLSSGASAGLAAAVAECLKSEPVYDYLLQRQLQSTEPLTHPSEQKTILEIPIFTDSEIDGHYVHELNLPNQCLLIAIKRGSHEIIQGEIRNY